MANVAHSTLTSSNLHEPKGIATATAGQAYLADGTGSGAWTTLAGVSFTGIIVPWGGPIAPSGWYELNGATISSTTDAPLYNAYTIQGNGTRTSGTALISGLASTTNFRVGYYIFGTGIPAGTTILSIDSATDVTMSANASSSGTSQVDVSPWSLVSGGMVLPDMTTAGRFLRSRTTASRIGLAQASQNKTHTHPFTTDSGGAISQNSNGRSASHNHDYLFPNFTPIAMTPSGATFINVYTGTQTTLQTAAETQDHTHGIVKAAHVHTGTTDADGSSEARPDSLIVMYIVKR